MNKKRCNWVKLSDETYVAYHDKEWGFPLHCDKSLFELFSLETQAAGLSWLTVLKKRNGYREAFADFDLQSVIRFTCKDIDRIMQMNVIKNRLKLESIVNNAKLFSNIQKEFGSINDFFWSYVNFKPIINQCYDYRSIATTSLISDKLTKELKIRGFKFIGTITIYAFMQASGMVNDHESGCFIIPSEKQTILSKV